jgi:hypothetical protein
VERGSGEYLLWDNRNGGDVVFVRALHSTFVVLAIALLLKNGLDPARTFEFSCTELRNQVLGLGPWFGTVFAGTYAALYARFASQWTYLAGVYNQIKAAECRQPDPKPIAEWKAGFIEDAEDLHLIRKQMFASIARAWMADPAVRSAFEKHAPGGSDRFARLKDAVETATSAATIGDKRLTETRSATAAATRAVHGRSELRRDASDGSETAPGVS